MKVILTIVVLAVLAAMASAAVVTIYPVGGRSCPAGGGQEVDMAEEMCVFNAFADAKHPYQRINCLVGDAWTYTESPNADCSGGQDETWPNKDCQTLFGGNRTDRSIRVDCSGANPQAIISWISMALAILAVFAVKA